MVAEQKCGNDKVQTDEITGIILAGGRARRLGGVDKGLLVVAERPLVAHVKARLAGQVAKVCINANRNLATYTQWGLPILTDRMPNFAGPLAGVHVGLTQANTTWVLFVPCDAPLVPLDLAKCLVTAIAQKEIMVAVAVAGGRVQPTFMLCRRTACADLTAYLTAGGRSMQQWYPRVRHIEVPFPDADAFASINTPADLARMQKRLEQASNS